MKKLISFFTFLIFLSPVFAQFPDIYSFSNAGGASAFGDVTLLNGRLYGITAYGGANGVGSIYRLDTNGSGFKDMFDFSVAQGAYSTSSLIYHTGKFYSMAYNGGAHNYGCVFAIDTNGSNYKDLLDFTSTNGAMPQGSLMYSSGVLYGMTSAGGANNDGCIFSIDTNGSNYKDMLDFNATNGSTPRGTLAFSGKKLYGVASVGGAHNYGCFFCIDTNGHNYKDMFDFNNVVGQMFGAYPAGEPLLLGDKLYGMTYGGGSFYGAIYSIDTNGAGFSDMFFFNDTDGFGPVSSLKLLGKNLYGTTTYGGLSSGGGVGNIFSIDTNGNRFRNLLDFNTTNGKYPQCALTISGNSLYGTTSQGGANDSGVVFKMDTNISTSINNLKASINAINVYPNPSSGLFNVVIASEAKQSYPNIEVYNILGEKVYSQFTIYNSQFTIDLSSNPSGVYLYRILAQDGGLVGEGKLIIQK